LDLTSLIFAYDVEWEWNQNLYWYVLQLSCILDTLQAAELASVGTSHPDLAEGIARRYVPLSDSSHSSHPIHAFF
jgi:hypothetical protein